MTPTPSIGGLLIQERARALTGNFSAFAQAAWPILEPTTTLVLGKHIEILSEYLMAVSAGQIKRLILNLPPRLTKSTLATILWPCWSWAGDDATSRWMFASYSASLSVKHSIDRRTLLMSDWYQKLWPQVVLAGDQNEKSQYASNNRGTMLSTSVGATATGKGGSVIVVDDPHSVTQALSDTERASAIRWFKTTLSTRLDDPRTGAIVVIMQRLHQDDLTGSLLADGGWTHLSLPATAEQRTVIGLPMSGREIVREVDDLLEPQRLSQRTLDDLKISMGSLAFSGQYMQSPAPTSGNIFKRAWWKRFTVVPAAASQVIQSWDLTFREADDSDFVVGQTWCFQGATGYLVDQFRKRCGYVETKSAIREQYAKWPNTSACLIEAKANGDAILDELKSEIPGLIGIEPSGGKLARAWACSSQIEGGQIYIPEAAAWAEDFLLECSLFPAGAHDDMVDSMSQCLNYHRTHGAGGVYTPSLTLGTTDDPRAVIYDAAAHPEWSTKEWYRERYTILSLGIARSCILEILSRESYDPFFVAREFYIDGHIGFTDLFKELVKATHIAHKSSGLMECDSALYMAETADVSDIRTECLRHGIWLRTVTIEPDELLTTIQRVATMFDRRKVRVSSDCRHFIQEHREFRYDVRKAIETGKETVILDSHPTVDAFRLFVSQVHVSRRQ